MRRILKSHQLLAITMGLAALLLTGRAQANSCGQYGCFVYTSGANWGFQVGGNDANNVPSVGSAAYLSSSPNNNTGGVQYGDDVTGWLGLRDNIGYNACDPVYSPSPCLSVDAPGGIFIQVGIAHDYPSSHGLSAQTSWRGRVDCGPNTSETVFTSRGDFTSSNPDDITYDCYVANPSLDGYDLTNGSWVQIIPQYGDRVNVYVGNTWIMAVFDSASQVDNNQLIQETNLYGTPSAEIGTGLFDLVSSRTMYLSGGYWYDYPDAPGGGASAWSFIMSTLNVNNDTKTFGNNPCMFYDPNTLPDWVGTQAGFNVSSSMEAGRNVIDCWYDDGVTIHTGLQRSSPTAAPSTSTTAKPFVPPPFPSHRGPNAPKPTGAVGQPVPMHPATPTPAAPNQPASPHQPPPAPPPPTVMPSRTPTPGPSGH